MLSRHSTNATIIFLNCPFNQVSYIEQYAKDAYFKDLYEYLMHGTQIENHTIIFMIIYCIILAKLVFHKVKEFM